MIRVPGEAELYVDVDWKTRAVRVYGRGEASLLWLTPSASNLVRVDLVEAEFRLEGVPGVHVWERSGAVERLDFDVGLITFVNLQITCVQSEHLRALLQRAEEVLRTGVGDMNTPVA